MSPFADITPSFSTPSGLLSPVWRVASARRDAPSDHPANWWTACGNLICLMCGESRRSVPALPLLISLIVLLLSKVVLAQGRGGSGGEFSARGNVEWITALRAVEPRYAPDNRGNAV